MGLFPNPVLASAEDYGGNLEASLSYTGLIPHQRYLLMVDDAGAKTGTFCVTFKNGPPLLNNLDTCETFTRTYAHPPSAQSDQWINLYGTRQDFEDGPLLAALRTSEDLGPITVSVKRTTNAPVLANGLKLLPRYFNINTTKQPQFPVQLRLFYSIEDYMQFLTAPIPVDSVPVFTFYDGMNEDCSPFNNGSALATATQTSPPIWVGNAFYIEGVVTHFSEFSAGGHLTSRTTEPGFLASWRVYPNPTRDGLWIAGELPAPTDLQATLLHLTGEQVWQKQWSSGSGKQQQYIPLEMLPAGMYQLLLRAAQTGESVVLKVFVE